MKIEIVIDKKYNEPKICIFADEMTDEISELIKRLSDPILNTLTAFTEKGAEIIDCNDILRIYSELQRVYIQTVNGIYKINARLYELEEELDGKKFVRISNSEIINVQKIRNMDVSHTGTICIYLAGDIKTYVSRRYMPKIKKSLGIKR